MRTIISALIAVSLAVGLVACAPTNDKPQAAGTISATAEGIDVSVTTPVSPAIDATSAAAAASAVDLLPVGYLMTRPSDITASGTIPASGVELTLTLPAALPKDTVGRFSYFDEDANAWVPVETTVSGTTATARVDHLSLWSFIVAGAEDVLDDLAEQFSAVADGVTTIVAGAADAIAAGADWFSSEVPRWIYRQGGLFLGIQATEPTCSDAPLPAWVEATDISKLTGIADEALPVLRCVEADEDDPSLVRVRAVMNRGYGFQMEFGSSIYPAGWEFGVFESALQVDLAALSEVLLAVSKSMPFPSPTKLLSPTNETSFTVSEAQVRALEPEEVVVIFTRPTFDYYAMTVAMKWVVDQVAGQAEGMMAFVVALDSCNYNQVIQPDSTAQPAEWAGFITRCVDELTGEQIEKTMAQFVAEAPDASDVPVKTPASLKTIRKALSALKWLDAVVVALTTIDYAGDVNPLYVDLFAKEIVPPKPVVLGEGANGEWCLEGRVTADGCTTIVVGTDPNGVVTEFTRPVDGCFAGTSYGPMGGGVSLVYCPAGAQVPAEFAPMFANGTNDTTRDRLWPYQGFGALPFYRKE